MNDAFARFVSSIAFRWIQPEDEVTKWHQIVRFRLDQLGYPLDLLITRLPEDGWRLRRLLRPVCLIPRMSTFAVGAILNRAVAQMAPQAAFVNVGVWHGFTLLSGMAGNGDRRCIGVDNFSEFGGPRDEFLRRFDRYRSPLHAFHEMDYRAYFTERHRDPIGVYLYDGEHGYENQLHGLEVAERFFTPGCVIVVDDTNQPEPREATLAFAGARAGKYRTLLDRRTSANGHPTFWDGLLVLQRTA